MQTRYQISGTARIRAAAKEGTLAGNNGGKTDNFLLQPTKQAEIQSGNDIDLKTRFIPDIKEQRNQEDFSGVAPSLENAAPVLYPFASKQTQNTEKDS